MGPFNGLIKTFENDATTLVCIEPDVLKCFKDTPRAEFSRKRCVDMAYKKNPLTKIEDASASGKAVSLSC